MKGFTDEVEKNMRLNEKELSERKKILKSYPIKIYVEPTQRCNLDCWMCDWERRRSIDDMDIPLFRKIEKELFSQVAEVDFFLNGEPLLSKHFPEMIETSKNYSFLPKIFTNGLLLDEKNIDLLVSNGVFVNISFDGGTETIYDSVRGKGNFSRVIPKIKQLLEIDSMNPNDRFHVRFAVTLGMHNLQEAPKIIRLARDLGIDDVMFGALDYGTSFEEHLTSDPEKTAFFLKLAKKEADDSSIRFSCPRKIGSVFIEDHHNWDDFKLKIDEYAPFSLEANNPYNGKCGYPWVEAIFRSDGQFLSCCQKHHYMGNFTTSSFRDIWNNEKYQRLRSQDSYFECLGINCNMTRYSIWK